MTAKDCGHHDDDDGHLACHLFSFLLGFIVAVLVVVLLIFLILRPTKPSFILRDAIVYDFNSTSSPTLLTTTIQVTISTRNPNARVGIYYQKLDAYASYRGQQITLPIQLPDSYQGHKEIVEWSPFLYGNSVPVSPFLATSLEEDQNVGTVLVNIKVDGRVKWKVGTWVSGKYLLQVNCPALLVFRGEDNEIPGEGMTVQPSMKIQATQHCTRLFTEEVQDCSQKHNGSNRCLPGQLEERFEDIDGSEVPLSYRSDFLNTTTAAAAAVLEDNSRKEKVVPGEDAARTYSDLNTSQNIFGGFMKVIPSDVDSIADYWPLSDGAPSMMTMAWLMSVHFSTKLQPPVQYMSKLLLALLGGEDLMFPDI